MHGVRSKLLAALVAGVSVAGLWVGGSATAPAPASAQEGTGAQAGSGQASGTARVAGVTGPVRAEIFVILARETEGTMDPALADIAALRRPPFNAFHSMEVLARPEMMLAPEHPIDVPLPNGRALRLELERATTDGRYRVRVSINTPGETDYLPLLQVVASPGDPFFVAGQNWLGGTLVIGVRIGQRPVSRKV